MLLSFLGPILCHEDPCLSLNQDDIEHVIERYESIHHKITHLHSYLKTMLYTISQENGHFYTNELRSDGIV